MSTTPTLQELLDSSIQAGIARVRVAMPAKVIKYDGDRETVDVQPQLKNPVEDDDGNFQFETLSTIPDVPILWPSGYGGSCYITFPLAKGDMVELVFNDFDIGVWRQQGEPANPGDLRMHGLSGAVAYPGIRTDTTKLGSGKVHASKVVIGDAVLLGGSGAAQSMIKGDAHKTEYDGHTHPTPMGPSGVPAVAMASLSTKHKLDS